MANKIQIRRGIKANLPVLSEGEFGLCTDTGELYIGSASGNISVSTGSITAENMLAMLLLVDGADSELDSDTVDGIHFRTTNGYLEYSTDGISWEAVRQKPCGTALPAATGTMTVTMDSETKNFTPAGSCTFNADACGVTGDVCTFIISTSGTTSYTMTWGTNFKTVGTLATGTVSGKVFTISFRKLGSVWYETGRTGAM